jgi:hypothetical protein
MIKDKTGKEWRVSVVTPAGREKYLSIFKKYIYKEIEKGLVDEWQLWQNTIKESDISYIGSMAAENPKVKVFTISNIENRYNFCDTTRTCEFFSNCHDDNTIYIRFDDDIVWYEPGAIERMCFVRIQHSDAYLIYPTVINSTTVTNWHQRSGALSEEAGILHHKEDKPEDPNWIYLEEFNYTDSKLIDLIHDTFKKKYEEKNLSDYYLESRYLLDHQRFSICSICWWGKDHILPGPSEEPQLSWELPEKENKHVYFLGDALMVHYSYHTQRDYLESCSPEKLEFYKQLSENL